MNSSNQQSPKPLKRSTLRPSTLDALARCAWYRSEPRPTVATTRGNTLDGLLRARFRFPNAKLEVPLEDWPAFEWGEKKTRELAGGLHIPILTQVKDCRVFIPILNRIGTCDAVAPRSLISFDWKSGQRRPYARQMAAYALGQTEALFAPEWTCVVLFLDEQETEVFRYTHDEARAIVAEAVAAYEQPGPPALNESCSWCANFYDCPVQTSLAAKALQVPDYVELGWPAILADPARLAKFLDGCRALERFAKEGRARAREYFFQKTPLPGYTLVKGKASHHVPTEVLLNLLRAGDDIAVRKNLLAAVEVMGPISKKDYLELCLKLGLEPNLDLLTESRGEPFVKAK